MSMPGSHRPSADGCRDHAVHFYADEPSLFRTVGAFLREGLDRAQPVLIIATATHTAGILADLQRRGVDVRGKQDSGEIVTLDAERMLEGLVSGDVPDKAVFDARVGRVVADLLEGKGSQGIRVYGELVDLLWKSGRSEAAVRLEVLWNRLARSRAFDLLCAYTIGSFYKQTDVDRVVAEHTRAVAAVPTRLTLAAAPAPD